MPSGVKQKSKKRRLREIAEKNGWSAIGEAEWAVLAASVAGARSEDLRAAALPAEAPWRGVDQHTLDELEESLLSMTDVYKARADLRTFCRNEVIRAKDLARILSRARPEKAEMVEWMLIWLSDPTLFPVWVRVRKQIIDGQ